MASDDDQAQGPRSSGWKIDTVLSHAGLDPRAFHGFVNPPVVRASTVIFESAEALLAQHELRYPYGLSNTPTIEALASALSQLEGAAGTVLVPSGLAAVTTAILAAARPGAQILVPDNVYGPTRRFCDQSLPGLGMQPRYYDPLIGAGIAGMMGNVAAVLLEAPGSLTFEMPDISVIAAAARESGAVTMIDNTWATPLIYRPLEHGIDMVIHAGTKYIAGHADLLIGCVSANEALWPRLKRLHKNLGIQAGPEEIWLTLRGLRTLGVRLERHERSALQVARWLKDRREVARVLHPALPDDPGHAIWRREFGRSCGLFGVVLRGEAQFAMRFLNSLKLFGIGESWGGFESLAVPAELSQNRTVRPWSEGPVVRLHVGLENPEDLIADLHQAFAAARSHLP